MERFSYVWFDLNGRIKRRTWLVFAAAILFAESLTELLLQKAFLLSGPSVMAGAAYPAAYLNDRTALLTGLIFLWPSIAVDVKRWHDMGKSGWNALIVYGPVIAIFVLEAAGIVGTIAVPDPLASGLLYVFGLIVLAYFIFLAARKGAPVANRFGPA
jgi:uncharacterized membrane protein YhaH (DUF805 family)